MVKTPNKKKLIPEVTLTGSLPARVTPEAHSLIPTLCKIYADEKGMPVSFKYAVSLAVKEAVERRQAVQ